MMYDLLQETCLAHGIEHKDCQEASSASDAEISQSSLLGSSSSQQGPVDSGPVPRPQTIGGMESGPVEMTGSTGVRFTAGLNSPAFSPVGVAAAATAAVDEPGVCLACQGLPVC